MITPNHLLGAVALASALIAQGPQDVAQTPHVAPPAIEPLAVGGSDAVHAVLPATGRGTPIPRSASPIHTAPADNGVEYGIWACGADYKVSFHGGMTFVPYLGRDYPHNQPFGWKTRSVRIGGAELVRGEIEPRQGEYRYAYDLGGVDEVYDVRAEGLEQTFVIDKRPAGAHGDLIVEGEIESLMDSAAREARHQAIDFYDASGDRIFTYGAAFAVDACGMKVPMTTAYADGVITLSLAARALETLTFPVTVDPLLGNVALRGGPMIGPVCDCVREDESTSDNLWFTYSRAASATDEDVYVWRLDDQWAGSDLAAFQDLTNSWSALDPAIASVSGADKVVTAFVREFVNGESVIRWHAHEYSDVTMNTFVGIRSNPTGTTSWRPDIGGTAAFTTGTTGIIVFQREGVASLSNTASSDIFAFAVDFAGTGQGSLGPDRAFAVSAGLDNERPRINQQSEGGSNPSWAVVFQTYANSTAGDDWDVGFRMIDDNALSITSTLFTEAGGTHHKLGPVVAGQSGRYAVMYGYSPLSAVNFKTSLTTGHDLHVRRMDYDAATGSLDWGSNIGSIAELGFTTLSRRWIPGGLAYDTDSDSHWMMTFASNSSDTAYCALTGYRGGFVTHETVLSSPSLPALGGVTYDDDGDEFLMLVGSNDSAASNIVYGDVFEYTIAATESLSGTSCNPATLSWNGRGTAANHQHAIGQEFGEIRVTGANPGDLHFMVMSLDTANSRVTAAGVAPGCRLLVDATGPSYLGILDFRIGATVSWDQPIPEFLAADTIYFQDWVFDGVAFTSTQRMAVDIVK